MKPFVIAFVLLIPVAVQGSIIDSFEVGPQTVIVDSLNNNVSNSLSGLDTSHVLYGGRGIVVQGELSAGSLAANVNTSGGGSLRYVSNNPVFTNSFDGRLLVGHIGGDRFNTFDLTAFAMQFYTVDFENAYFGGNGPFDAIVRVTSPSGSDSAVLTIPESSTPFQVAIPMSDLSGADLSRAFNLRLDIGGIPSVGTFEINNINFVSNVPEPNSALLLLLIMACVVVGRYCKHRTFVSQTF